MWYIIIGCCDLFCAFIVCVFFLLHIVVDLRWFCVCVWFCVCGNLLYYCFLVRCVVWVNVCDWYIELWHKITKHTKSHLNHLNHNFVIYIFTSFLTWLVSTVLFSCYAQSNSIRVQNNYLSKRRHNILPFHWFSTSREKKRLLVFRHYPNQHHIAKEITHTDIYINHLSKIIYISLSS